MSYGWEGSRGARLCSQQKGALSESLGQQYSHNRNMGALLALQGIICFAVSFQKTERPRKNIRSNFFFQKKKKKKKKEISRENVTVTLTTEAQCAARPALCLAIAIPCQEDGGSGRRILLLCQPVFGEKKKLRTALHRDLQGCASVPSAFFPPQSTAQKPTTTHLPNPPCQAAGQRLGFAFSEHEGIVLESASRAKGEEGHAAFVPNPIPSFTLCCTCECSL